jgi:hypothetical protein
LRQAVFLDDQARPQIGEQPVFMEQLTLVLDEIQQGFDEPGLDVLLRAVAGKQQVAPGVEPKLPELVNGMRL